MPPLTPQQKIELANELIEKGVSRTTVEGFLMRIDIQPMQIEISNNTERYYTNIIQYLSARSKL